MMFLLTATSAMYKDKTYGACATLLEGQEYANGKQAMMACNDNSACGAIQRDRIVSRSCKKAANKAKASCKVYKLCSGHGKTENQARFFLEKAQFKKHVRGGCNALLSEDGFATADEAQTACLADAACGAIQRDRMVSRSCKKVENGVFVNHAKKACKVYKLCEGHAKTSNRARYFMEKISADRRRSSESTNKTNFMKPVYGKCAALGEEAFATADEAMDACTGDRTCGAIQRLRMVPNHCEKEVDGVFVNHELESCKIYQLCKGGRKSATKLAYFVAKAYKRHTYGKCKTLLSEDGYATSAEAKNACTPDENCGGIQRDRFVSHACKKTSNLSKHYCKVYRLCSGNEMKGTLRTYFMEKK